MEAKLSTGTTDFSLYVKENGISHREIVRQSRSIVALDGTEYRSRIVKQGLSVQLVEMRDTTLAKLLEGVTSPAEWTYSDKFGSVKTGTFYITGPTATAKTVRGGNTYLSGVSFELEER